MEIKYGFIKLDNNNKFFELKTIQKYQKFTDHFKNIEFWIWLIITFGIILRLVQYFHNRSLFVDDAALSLNIVNRSFFQLFQPLDNDQAAPFGFLAITKLSTILFGNNEFALRLFPLVSGIIALILFYKLSKEYLTPFGVIISVGLFSITEPLYYYASAVKQYSSDVLFAIILFLLFTKLKSAGTSNSNITLFSLTGAVVIWFSFPSVFVLASIGILWSFYFLKEQDWKSFFKVIGICIIWLISFISYYFTDSLKSLSHNNYMQDFWSKLFMPVPSISSSYIRWMINAFSNFFTFVIINEASALIGFFFILGLIAFYKNNIEAFYIFILPIVITLSVSCFHLYPFSGRVILFLIPPVILFIAGGLELIKILTAPYKSIIIISTIFIFLLPSYYAAWNLYKPIEKNNIKQILTYLGKNIKPDDEIYLFYKSSIPFEFYKSKYNLTKYHVIEGVETYKDWQKYIVDLDQLKGKKNVWVLFTQINKTTIERILILTHLNSIGTLKKSFRTAGAEVDLFDLSINKNF